MFMLRGSSWGPGALPDVLRAQLADHGFGPEDAGRCARLINEQQGGDAAASLFVDLGSCKFLEADIDGAIAAWRHAIASQHDAAAARAMLNLGLLYEHLHLYERALGLLARVAERNVEPYVVPAAMASARAQLALGQGEQAMETMARLAQMAMVRRPDGTELIEALYGLGDVAEQAGRLDRAERAWRVAAASPDSELQQHAAARLAQLLVRQGRGHAVALLDNRSSSAETSAALLETVELLLRTGEKTAAAALLASIDRAPFGASDRFRFADANLMAGRINEAIDELESLLGDDETQARALVSLGRVYVSYDMIDPAVSMLQRAVATDDPYWMPAASLALGDVLAARGDVGPANEYWSYAAAGAVPRLAEQAQERIDAKMAEPVAASTDESPTLIGDVSLGPETLPLDEAESAEASAEPLIEAVEGAPEPGSEPIALIAESEAETAEPQLISLDAIDDELQTNGSGTSANGFAANGPVPSEPQPEPEPVLVVLADIDDGDDQILEPPVVIDAHGADAPAEDSSDRHAAPASVFAAYVGDELVPNPYAALAPDGHASDIAPTKRNPYAELAPNFGGSEFDPPDDVEPGDWESMLGDRPAVDPPKPKKRSSAFSRYT